MDLDGAVTIVTGAARGIGRAIAEAFADRGARVVIANVLADELEKTAAELRQAGGTVLAVPADVTDATQVAAMAATVEAALGPAQILVNNAATFSCIGPLWEAEPERWFRDIRVSLYGSFLCCRAVLPGMVERRAGYIINMVSSGGVGDPHAYSTSYACAKTALMRLTDGPAKEVAEYGVKVFALAPATVRSEMTRFC